VLVLDDAVLAAPHGSRSTGHAITAHGLGRSTARRYRR
jgi:hypothetical protein